MDIPVAEFFNTGLEEDAVLTTASSSSSIKVHFLNEYESLGAEIQFESSNLQVYAQTSDVANASHGNTLTINGTDYYILEMHPDGTGITTILLSEEQP